MGAAGLLAGSTFLRIYTRGPDPLVYDSPQRPVCSRDLRAPSLVRESIAVIG